MGPPHVLQILIIYFECKSIRLNALNGAVEDVGGTWRHLNGQLNAAIMFLAGRAEWW